MHDARMFRLLLPKSLGGDEIELPVLAQVTEIIAALVRSGVLGSSSPLGL